MFVLLLHCDAKGLVRLGKLAGQPAGDHIELSRSLAREEPGFCRPTAFK